MKWFFVVENQCFIQKVTDLLTHPHKYGSKLQYYKRMLQTIDIIIIAEDCVGYLVAVVISNYIYQFIQIESKAKKKNFMSKFLKISVSSLIFMTKNIT